MHRFGPILLSLCLVAPAANAQRETFEGVTDVVTVEVPVHVVKDGVSLRGLTIDDFELTDGRKKQVLTSVEMIDLAEVTAAEGQRATAPVPLVARRHFLFLFDLSFSRPGSIQRARHAALDLIGGELHPTDLVAVGVYSIQEGPDLILGFTPDREQATAAIESLGLARMLNPVTDPLNLLITKPGMTDDGLYQPTGSGETSQSGRAGANFEGMIQQHLEDLSIATERANRDIERNRVMAWSRGIQDLGALLASVEGRKHVVYLSEGVDSTVITGLTTNERNEEMAQSSADGRYWEVDNDERFGNTASMATLDEMYEAFRRADAMVHSVDVGGLRAGPDVTGASQRGREQTLFMFADSTGGELYRNFNDLGEAMGQLLQRTSVTYVLSFQPEELDLDGSFHKLRVKLKDGPRGARVIHRQGYFAPRPFEVMNAAERRFDAANQVMSGVDAGPVESSVLAAPFRFGDEPAYVPVLVELDGQTLLANQADGRLLLEIYGYAMSVDGRVADYFSQSLGFEMGKIEGALQNTGVKFFGSFDLMPGEYSLRILVRNAQNGETSVRTVPLAVPEWGQQGPVLLSPLFPEPLGKWLLIREAAADEENRGVPYPFMLGDEPYLPAANPVLTSAMPAPLALVGYNLGSGPLAVEAKVLDAGGTPVPGPTIDGLEVVESGDTGVDRLKGLFSPGQLAPGDYTLVVDVNGGALSSSIPFTVDG